MVNPEEVIDFVEFDEHDVHEWAGRMYECDDIISRIRSGEFKSIEDVDAYAAEQGRAMAGKLGAVGALNMFKRSMTISD